MAAPKVFTVIKAMNEEELAEIDKIVSTQKRPSLKKLLKLIVKTNANAIDKLDKELVYVQVFGKKYSAEQDYIWRNELRLLMEVAEEYAAQKMLKQDWDTSTTLRSKYFLKYLISKNLFPLVLSEGEQLKKTAKEEYDYRSVVDTCHLLFPYLDNHAWNNMDAQEEAEANNIEFRESVNRNYLQNYRRTQIAYYGSKLFKYKENFKPVSPDPGLSKYFGEYEDPYTEYLSLRLQTIALPNAIDITIYHQCLDQLDRHPNIPNAIREKFMLLNNLSAYYFFKYDYEKALHYNGEQMKIMDRVDDVLSIILIYNYASNFAHMGRYDDVLSTIAEHKNFIRQFPNQVERFRYIEASSYALKGDKVNFNKIVPKQFDELSKMMQQHYRFLIAISHFLDGEYALAETEVNNIERGIKALKSEKLNYHDGALVASEHLGIFFDIYQKYQLDGDKVRTGKRIEALEKLIQEFVSTQHLSGGLLFYIWMRKQLSKLKEKVS
jgi:hypothetical protein